MESSVHKRPTILYLTDLNYKAAGRDYYKEDILLTGLLKDHFDIIITHPTSSHICEKLVDLIVIRNTGPIVGYQHSFTQFQERVKQFNLNTFNSLDGKADIHGKNYLPDLFKKGYRVIPSITSLDNLESIPDVDDFFIKPLLGADSRGIQELKRDELSRLENDTYVIQPKLNIQEEHSLFYLDSKFCYALKTNLNRWELLEFEPGDEEIDIANTFIDWNQMKTGIQRVDLALTEDGLFLVELEDINPFLSLHKLQKSTKESFLELLIKSLTHRIMDYKSNPTRLTNTINA